MLPDVARLLRRLHRDDDGKMTVEMMLLIAFITIPLLAVLIAFRDKVIGALKSAWDGIFGGSQAPPTNF